MAVTAACSLQNRGVAGEEGRGVGGGGEEVGVGVVVTYLDLPLFHPFTYPFPWRSQFISHTAVGASGYWVLRDKPSAIHPGYIHPHLGQGSHEGVAAMAEPRLSPARLLAAGKQVVQMKCDRPMGPGVASTPFYGQ